MSFRTRLAAAMLVVAAVSGVAVTEHATATTGHGAPTVVAVVEPYDTATGFNPYHLDFAGSTHPWTGFDFQADPATYLAGYPAGVPALGIDLPDAPGDDVSVARKNADPAWAGFEESTLAAPKMYRFPGAKIIGALRFGSYFYGDNDAHGTRSAASAVGNIHGTCPECLVVMVQGTNGLAWALSQPWIDVVTNSWTTGQFSMTTYLPDTRTAVVRGQSVVWSSGNGMLNANDVPNLTYASGIKGPDWVVTVGSTHRGKAIAGAGKPVDIAAEGFSYPSTGGATADGEGTHRGTSNAAPMVAGALGTIIQRARDLVGDTAGGQRPGAVVASGADVTCGAAYSTCPLADGDLTRAEAERVLFHNVSPTAVPTTASTGLPSSPVAYVYAGHGVVRGRDEPAGMTAQQNRFRDVLRGDLAPLARPAGETGWMVADSRCRQRIWGTWAEGYHQGSEPPDAGGSPLAAAWNEWCTEDVAARFRDAVGHMDGMRLPGI